MGISKVELSNFKSFYKASALLSRFNVIVGANASGKSNFVQFFKFIKDIGKFGMDDAISMQGGSEYLFNANHPKDNVLYGKIINETQRTLSSHKEIGIGFEIFRECYEIDIEASNTRTYIRSVSDRFINYCKFFKYKRVKEGRNEELESLGEGKISIVNTNGEVSFDINPPASVETTQLKEDIVDLRVLDNYFKDRKIVLGRRQSLLELYLPLVSFISPDLSEKVTNIAIFDIDPRLTKRAQPVTGHHDLESDGSNLATVIRRLCKNYMTRRQMENIIQDLLPFVEAISIKKLEDNVIIRVRERFKSSHRFPAFLLSDGTLNLTALSVVLFFENKPLKIIEEPERNIHPHLISKIVSLMREASEESQIITTTHNPEIVRHANIDELLLVSRDHLGDSNLSRPGEQRDIKDFLHNKLGIEELYVQSILEKYHSKEHSKENV
jgi:predicted ATPase